MDKNGKIDFGQLTHILVRGLGWIPVDNGMMQRMFMTERVVSEDNRLAGSGEEHEVEVVVFKAEGKTIAINPATIDGWKFK